MTQEWEEMARCHWILIHSILSLNVVKIDYVLTGSDKNYEIPKEPKVVKSK